MDKLREKVNNMHGSDAVVTRGPLPLGRDAQVSARVGRFRVLTGIFLVLLCAALIVSAVFTPAVEIYREGVYVGTLSNTEQVDEVVSQVEARVAEILGYDYGVDALVTTRTTVTRRSQLNSVGAIRAAIYRDVDVVTTAYALRVNGQLVGRADEPARLQATMEQLAARYASLGQLDTPIKQCYTIEYTTIPADTATELGDISAAADRLIDFTTVSPDSYTVEIPYETEYVLDEELYVGESYVSREGVTGVRTVQTEIRRLDGEVTGMSVVGSEITVEPVSEVIAVGAKFRPASASYGEYIWPTEGIVSSYYGQRSMGYHEGIDICNALNTPIVAADGGEVLYADDGISGYGNLVVLSHDDGTMTVYGHMNYIAVEKGERVFRGQEVGGMGTTGRSTGVHLHFEIIQDGVSLNPMDFLPAE